MLKRLLAVLIIGVVASGAAWAGPELAMRMIGAEPAMINGPQMFYPATGNGYLKVMTINPATGVIYGMDTYVSNNGRAETFLLDSTIISTPSAPSNALVGGVAPVNASQYTGSVYGDGGTTDNSTINPPQGTAITFNPDYNEGALVALSGANSFVATEWAVQDTSVGWGHTVETSWANKAARYATATATFSGYSQGVREGFGYLDRATVSGGTLTDVYRYVWAYKKTGVDALRVAHVDASGFSTTPTDLTTGARSSQQRGGGYTLLTTAQLYGLAPAGSGLNGLAVRGEVTDDEFDVYMLFTDSDGGPGGTYITYLTGIRATVPSGGTAMSYTVIDLDATSSNTYLQLIDTAASADLQGTAIVWDPNGTTLYVAGYLDYGTGTSYDLGRIYIFDEILPVAEPAGLGFIGLALLGLKKRRS
jgi:hypothetical protein